MSTLWEPLTGRPYTCPREICQCLTLVSATSENRLVSLVYLVCLVCLVERDEPDEQNKPDKLDQPVPLAMTYRLC
jgi:hypothetical protein